MADSKRRGQGNPGPMRIKNKILPVLALIGLSLAVVVALATNQAPPKPKPVAEPAQAPYHYYIGGGGMLDIDHFKDFNDRYGHQAGDQALVAVSKAARALLRTEDTWCRFGGEEFLALLPRTEAAHAMVMTGRPRGGSARRL